MSQIITPQMIEQKLRDLSKEVDHSHLELASAEHTYYLTRAKYELALAKGRLSFAGKQDIKLTVSDKADMALVSTEDLHIEMAIAEALVRAARSNASRIRTQVDIARSVGTSVRTSMELA
jgi:hypothetical protein